MKVKFNRFPELLLSFLLTKYDEKRLMGMAKMTDDPITTKPKLNLITMRAS